MDLWRFARHLNLDGVGPEGQARLGAASVVVSDRDEQALGLARRYLEAAGVGRVVPRGEAGDGPAWVEASVEDEASRSVVRGSVRALAAMRAVLAGEAESGGERG